MDDGEWRSPNAAIPKDSFRHALVEGDAKRQRIRKYVRQVVGFQQRRHLGLTGHTFQAFAKIEYTVPSIASREPLRQSPYVADPFRDVAERRECVADR